jgi:hypothetical protein
MGANNLNLHLNESGIDTIAIDSGGSGNNGTLNNFPTSGMWIPHTQTFTGILDTYPGANSAFSLRRLSSSYTGPLIEVRSSLGGLPQDIGYGANNELDVVALQAFIGAGDGFITTWYDQSGNANNAISLVASEQPTIASGGVIQYTNGKPSIYSDDLDDNLTISATTALSGFTVAKLDNISGVLIRDFLSSAGIQGVQHWGGTASAGIAQYDGSNSLTISTLDTLQHLVSYTQNGADGTLTSYGGTFATATSAFNQMGGVTTIFQRGTNSGFRFVGTAQEIILYATTQHSNKAGIDNDIKLFYSI